MKNYSTIKANYQKSYDSLMAKHKVFFAFSNEQLAEGKLKIGVLDNKDLTSIGAGGFMPKAEAKEFFESCSEATKKYEKELRAAKEAKESAIYYELCNHESFYAGNIEPVVDLFEGIYTTADIKAVYKKYASGERKFINKEND